MKISMSIISADSITYTIVFNDMVEQGTRASENMVLIKLVVQEYSKFQHQKG